jgi:hypothetical protein
LYLVGQVRKRLGRDGLRRWKYFWKVSTTKSVPFVPGRPGQRKVYKGTVSGDGNIFEKYQQRNQYLLYLVGQVRERFRKGRFQEMEIFWKVSTTKSVPFVPGRPGQRKIYKGTVSGDGNIFEKYQQRNQYLL